MQTVFNKPLLRPGHVRHARRRNCSARASASPAPKTAENSVTYRKFQELAARDAEGSQAGGAGGATTYEALKRADAAWLDLRTRKVWGPKPEFVRTTADPLRAAPEFDVVVCGGTLGIFLACSLQLNGLKVAVVERGAVRGREQEWNISRNEMAELVDLGVLTEQEVEECITSEFNPIRAGFYGSPDVWTRDVLNLGVRPDRLVERVLKRFREAGGRVYDNTALSGMVVAPNGVGLEIGGSGSSSALQEQLTSRLVLDCMGHASPVVRQVRFGQKPDGICLVVGTCARGFPENASGDIIFTNSPSQPLPSSTSSSSSSSSLSHLQYYWEAFPAGSGPTDRTTYMFTYLDAHPDRPSLEDLLEDYWRLMPQYQGVDLDQLQIQRILFGCFPTFKDSPLEPGFDRILQVGDASGIQSPLSFGGFGALTRHLGRLTAAVKEALEADMTDRSSLALINAYSPALSGAWMLQRAMSIPADAVTYDPNFINTLLGGNFQAMAAMGEGTLKPFLQDVIQFKPLGQTMLRQLSSDLPFVPRIIARVGLGAILEWTLHFLALGAYTALDSSVGAWGAQLAPRLPPKQRYLLRRALDNWKYGCGADYGRGAH